MHDVFVGLRAASVVAVDRRVPPHASAQGGGGGRGKEHLRGNGGQSREEINAPVSLLLQNCGPPFVTLARRMMMVALMKRPSLLMFSPGCLMVKSA